MSSLTKHLRTSGSHGGLPFHPGCPVCREERLRGSLPDAALVGRRGKASLLAATLAVSSLGLPAAALAQGDAASPPAAVPDGGLDRIDSDDGMQPDDPAGEEDAPIGGENLIEPDPDDRREEPDPTPLSELAPEQPGEEIDGAPEPEPHAETVPTPVEPTVPVMPAPQPAPAPTPPVPVPPVEPTPPPPAGELIERPEGETTGGKARQVLISVEPNPPTAREGSQAFPRVAEPSPPDRFVDGQAAALAATPLQAAERSPAPGSDAATLRVSKPLSVPAREIDGDTYTVRPGDSLWSIARRLLGPNASAGRIAREVDRLWELNRERIATGDPDLLMVGTELRLR